MITRDLFPRHGLPEKLIQWTTKKLHWIIFILQ